MRKVGYKVFKNHRSREFIQFLKELELIYPKEKIKSNYSGTLNKSTNIDFGYMELSNKGFISKLKMKSYDINL